MFKVIWQRVTATRTTLYTYGTVAASPNCSTTRLVMLHNCTPVMSALKNSPYFLLVEGLVPHDDSIYGNLCLHTTSLPHTSLWSVQPFLRSLTYTQATCSKVPPHLHSPCWWCRPKMRFQIAWTYSTCTAIISLLFKCYLIVIVIITRPHRLPARTA